MKPLTMSEAEALEDATSPEADFRVAGAIALVRGSWRNDGAEGESVHLLANVAEQRGAAIALLRRLVVSIRLGSRPRGRGPGGGDARGRGR